jgi:nucleotide-binding universal stress UspA family protein
MKKKRSKSTRTTRRRFAMARGPTKVAKILATTDFSDESQAGVRYAVALAEKLNATVSLLHVVEQPSYLSGMESVVLARQESEVLVLARARLATVAKREAKADVVVTSSVCVGKPFHEITIAANKQLADLIVIATHGHTGVKRALLGSTAERVVRHARCPVLTVPARSSPKSAGNTRPLTLKNILVPIDFSEISKDALPWAALLAGQFGARLVLLHVTEKFTADYLLGPELTSEAVVPLIKQAEVDLECLARSVSKSTRVNVSSVVLNGRPFEEICREAKTQEADLIVLTTHGHTGLKHVWLGSTAERVVRHAHCPVLAVRELDRKTA